MSRLLRLRRQSTQIPIRVALGVLVLLVCAVVAAHEPDSAHAALRTAAGGSDSGSGGFTRIGSFLDKITTYLIWLAAPCAGLGVVMGGAMLIAGNPRASRVLGLVALGFAVIVTAKGLVA